MGFIFAFVPLYILGLMGATRRLDHYDASMGWQGLFIVAAFGVVLIMIGMAFQILQLFVSIRQRRKNLDTTGDPWDGRTLEWATPSPAPHYNFAITPVVKERDAFWDMKQTKSQAKTVKLNYQDIHMPKNSPFGIIIAGFAFIFGFAIIWNIWWLAILGLLSVIVCVLIRSSDDNSEYVITAKELREHDANNPHRNLFV